mgnify:FL=1
MDSATPAQPTTTGASTVLLPGMPGAYGSRHYRRGYSAIILVLDGISTLIGLGVTLLVFTWAWTPGIMR